MKSIWAIIAFLSVFVSFASAEEIPVSRFNTEGLTHWESKSFKGMTEERDLVADYRTLFGADPPETEAIVIMTDTANTGGFAQAWYGDITLSTERK